MHDRRSLRRAAFRHRPDPLQLQVFHVVAVDLIQRAVTRCVIIAPDHQPVAGVWIAQHRVRYRREILYFAGYGDSSGYSRDASALLARQHDNADRSRDHD
jgi:hypothetical protein